jgi:iron complex transport system substrate-binding protein
LRASAVSLLLIATTVVPAAWPARIVSAGTSVTETLCALGVAGDLVAADTASKNYIPEAANLPSIGTFRTLSAEGIISVRPTLVILAFDVGPPEAIQQLQAAGVKVMVAPRNYTADEVKNVVRFLAAALNRKDRGEEVVRSIEHDMKLAGDLQTRIKSRPRVIFCSVGANAPTGSISGANTRIDELIRMAGGVNPIHSFDGMRPMTDEGVIAAAPDMILITQRVFERSGMAAILQLPGVALTPAGRAHRIVPVSDVYFQGYGPGIGKAALDLARKLHPELK